MFDEVRETGEPPWVSLEAPAGWGKTRVAREFYARLAVRQSAPRYWPPTILEAASADISDVEARRKRVYPEVVRRPRGSLPEWMWWGIACSDRNGVPSRALVDDLVQLENHAPWLEAAWAVQARLRDRHGASIRELRRKVAEGASGEMLGKAVETILGGAIPGLGLATGLGQWTGKRLAAASAARRAVEAEATITTDRPRDDLLDDTVRLVSRLGVPRLPVVILVEDLHLSDSLLVELLLRLMRSQSAIMLLTTSWPGHLDDAGSPERRLESRTSLLRPDRLLRVRHGTCSWAREASSCLLTPFRCGRPPLK